MYSSAPVKIGSCWTDEEICMVLESLTKGSSIPENVTIDVNPYQHIPSNLPDDIWFFMLSEKEKVSEHGYWNARGEACEIFTNVAITGWRTTLEFNVGQAPCGQRTNWVMQEYRINHSGLHGNGNSKVSGVLCRVFSSTNPEMLRKMGGLENSGRNHFHPRSSGLFIQEPGSTTRQGSMIESQARDRGDNVGQLAANGGHLALPIEDMLDMDFFLRGDDYLELDDLADGVSRSSSSDNTSCLTISSDECFDSQALLRDLEDEINRPEHGKDANFKYSVAASARTTEVVMRPANLGSLIGSNGRQPPAGDADKKFLEKKDPKGAMKSQKAENGNEGTSNSRNVATSSSSHKAVPEEEKEARVKRMKKLKKKYLCFMPF